jgi:DNA-binding MarR family transcriptional regulator
MPGVTPSQQSAIVVLDRFGDMPVGELANRESIQPASLTRILDALEAAGYVTRERHPEDRRSVIVGLTAGGRDMALHVHEERDAWLAQRVKSLPPRDLAVLSAALPVLEGLLDESDLHSDEND